MPTRRRTRRATLKDVAAALGISAATVSNAYNRPDQLSADLRARILDTARELGYTGPDPLARSLRHGRSGVIGLLYADRLSYAFADPAAAQFLQGLGAATEPHGLGLLLLSGAARPTGGQPVTRAAVDGLIIYGVPEGDPAQLAALQRGVPLVMVDQQRAHGHPWIGVQDREGAHAAATHLLDHGHRRFGILSLELDGSRRRGPITPQRERQATFHPPSARLAGYRDALLAAGVDWTAALAYEVAENSPDEGLNAALTLLRSPGRPTALLCMSDQLALAALRAAHELGLRVPHDLSVVGFDDVPHAHGANLTTVHQPTAEKGRLAGERLIAALQLEPGQDEPGQDGPGQGEPKHGEAGVADSAPPGMVLPTHLIVRGSSGPAPR